MAHPLEDTLIARQITPTAMRLLVLDVLQQEPTALSLADVERRLKGVVKQIGENLRLDSTPVCLAAAR